MSDIMAQCDTNNSSSVPPAQIKCEDLNMAYVQACGDSSLKMSELYLSSDENETFSKKSSPKLFFENPEQISDDESTPPQSPQNSPPSMNQSLKSEKFFSFGKESNTKLLPENTEIHEDDHEHCSTKESKTLVEMHQSSVQLNNMVCCQMNKNQKLSDKIKKIEEMYVEQGTNNAVLNSIGMLQFENTNLRDTVKYIRLYEDTYKKITLNYSTKKMSHMKSLKVVTNFHLEQQKLMFGRLNDLDYEIDTSESDRYITEVADQMDVHGQSMQLDSLLAEVAQCKARLEHVDLHRNALGEEAATLEESLLHCKEGDSADDDRKSLSHLIVDYLLC